MCTVWNPIPEAPISNGSLCPKESLSGAHFRLLNRPIFRYLQGVVSLPFCPTAVTLRRRIANHDRRPKHIVAVRDGELLLLGCRILPAQNDGVSDPVGFRAIQQCIQGAARARL